MDDIVRKLVLRYKTNDPFELAMCLNINVWFADLGSGTRGLYVKKLWHRYIIIHERLDGAWARFVCAHELAHDRLHPGLNRFWLDDRSFFNVGKFERQANKFALRLLTVNDTLQVGESVFEFLERNNIPTELSKFYF